MRDDSLKVSIVIPTFDRPDDLAELLETIRGQTVRPWEIIVVDDNTPTDVIEKVCKEYTEKFQALGSSLKYMKNPRQRSAAIARNVGANVASGDAIMFLDDDILLHPDYIEKIVAVFSAHSSALGVQGWDVNATNELKVHPLIRSVQAFFRLQHYVKDSCRFTEYPHSLTRTINCEWLRGSNSTVKREVLAEFEFDENLEKYAYLEDLLFSYSIHKKYPDSLYMTPEAKHIHKASERLGMETNEKKMHYRQCRKYVLARLFGVRGRFIYYWQTMGMIIIGWLAKILSLARLSRKRSQNHQ